MTEAETEQKINALTNNVNALMKVVNEQANSIEQLAAIQGLEYSQDCKTWVSKEKLAELRSNPR